MKYVFIGLCLLLSLAVFSQTPKGKVSGTVQDANEGIVGATVVVLNTSWGTITDEKGGFELMLPEGKHTITGRFVGYETVVKEAVVVGNTAISLGDVLMKNTENQLDAVVVTGQFGPNLFAIRCTKSEPSRTNKSACAGLPTFKLS